MFYSSQNVNSYYFSVAKSQVIFFNFFFFPFLCGVYTYMCCAVTSVVSDSLLPYVL